MFEIVNNIFLGILGMNMAIIGGAMIIVPIVMLVKKKQEITNRLNILYIIVGPLLIYFGVYLTGKYLLH